MVQAQKGKRKKVARVLLGAFGFFLCGALVYKGVLFYESVRKRAPYVPLSSEEVLAVKSAMTDPEHAHQLYQMMQVVDEVFEASNITYWADSGTLLGAVRNKGLIPTDDDIDVAVLASDEPKLQGEAQKAFAARGYELKDYGYGYKVMRQGGSADLSLDVFLFHEERAGVWVHKRPRA